jgi:hypothetical protein
MPQDRMQTMRADTIKPIKNLRLLITQFQKPIIFNTVKTNFRGGTMTSTISRAKPDAKYQAYFENGPLSGWVVHINGHFKGIFATDSEAIAWAEEYSEQVTIDTRG